MKCNYNASWTTCGHSLDFLYRSVRVRCNRSIQDLSRPFKTSTLDLSRQLRHKGLARLLKDY